MSFIYDINAHCAKQPLFTTTLDGLTELVGGGQSPDGHVTAPAGRAV